MIEPCSVRERGDGKQGRHDGSDDGRSPDKVDLNVRYWPTVRHHNRDSATGGQFHIRHHQIPRSALRDDRTVDHIETIRNVAYDKFARSNSGIPSDRNPAWGSRWKKPDKVICGRKQIAIE